MSNFRVLMLYPNYQHEMMVPPALALFSALLKREGHTVDMFDTTNYKLDIGFVDSEKVKSANPEVIYNNVIYPRDKFLDTVSRSYAVIIASLGDISPNTILDAIRANRPFILTRETGLYEKLKDIALMVDPENIDDIAEKISMLCDPVIYETYRGKVARFTFTHTWEEIGNEIIDNFKSLL